MQDPNAQAFIGFNADGQFVGGIPLMQPGAPQKRDISRDDLYDYMEYVFLCKKFKTFHVLNISQFHQMPYLYVDNSIISCHNQYVKGRSALIRSDLIQVHVIQILRDAFPLVDEILNLRPGRLIVAGGAVCRSLISKL
jgi:hypothetical protein